MTWVEYWNRDTPIYVNARHRQAHYEAISRDIVKYVPSNHARVLDYGCGDTLSADRVAAACSHLFLCDSAPRVRESLAARYEGQPKISVIAPDQFEQLEPMSIDLIVVNSVVQYLSMSQLSQLLATSRSKLSSGGRLLLADIVPRHVNPLRDAAELLKFAGVNGFLLPAAAGLVKSYFSDYRQVRHALGFLQLDESEVISVLQKAGFAAERRHPNIGHNAARMTFLAVVHK